MTFHAVPDDPPDGSHGGVGSGTATQHSSEFYKHETDSSSQNPGGDRQRVPVDLLQPVPPRADLAPGN